MDYQIHFIMSNELNLSKILVFVYHYSWINTLSSDASVLGDTHKYITKHMAGSYCTINLDFCSMH